MKFISKIQNKRKILQKYVNKLCNVYETEYLCTIQSKTCASLDKCDGGSGQWYDINKKCTVYKSKTFG